MSCTRKLQCGFIKRFQKFHKFPNIFPLIIARNNKRITIFLSKLSKSFWYFSTALNIKYAEFHLV